MAIEEVLRIIDQGSPALASVSKSATRASAEMQDADDAARDLGSGIGKVGEGAAKARGSLSLLSPALGEMAGVANDAFDAFEVLNAAFGVGAGTLAALGAAAAVAGAAYLVLAHDLEEAEARAARTTAALDAMVPVFDALRQSKDDYRVATDQLTEAEARELDIRRQWNDTTTKAIGLLREQQAELAGKTTPGVLDNALAFWGLKDAADSYARTAEDMLGPAAFLAVAWNKDADEAKAAANEIAGLDARIVSLGKASEKGIELDVQAAAALDAKKDATKAASAAAKDAAEVERALARAAAEEERRLAAERTAAAKQRADEYEQHRRMMELEWQATLQQVEAEQQLAAARKADAESAVSATATGITGGPAAGVDALSNAGPWGELLAGLIDMVANLGDTLTDFAAYHEGLMDAIATLPETLADNMGSIFSDSFATILPDFLEALTDNLDAIVAGVVQGLVDSSASLIAALIVELPVALLEAFASFFTADFWAAIGQGIADAFAGLFDGSASSADTERTARVGRTGARASYDTGTTYVPETGLYQLHQGEEVINPTGYGTERQDATRAHATRATLTGGPRGMRVVAEFEIDAGSYTAAVEGMRRQGWAV